VTINALLPLREEQNARHASEMMKSLTTAKIVYLVDSTVLHTSHYSATAAVMQVLVFHYSTEETTQLYQPNFNLTDTIVSPKEVEDTSIWYNHTNTTRMFQQLVSMFTHSALNQKNTNHLVHAICLVSTTQLFT
jgi:hypothetical protein